jgi:hypothetical protein
MKKLPRILAHHLVISGYGFWIPNDPRGSGSLELRQEKFKPLGPIHPGRKKIQPSRQKLRMFSTDAERILDHDLLWFDAGTRDLIGAAFAEVIARRGYTVWACFVGTNHAHLCIRYHRDRYETMHANLAAQSRTSLLELGKAEPAHPVWAERPYSVFLHTPDDILRVIEYIRENAAKSGLPEQAWDFVKPYRA